ncbi:hypothetical protein ACIRPK_26705 [Kitasatospora sp. NPDC101801]|uniref:hypothetical protein n=1 Tax=Kitasatospora sp. NPDC101801 TaxID=3364103 RepID=UPI0037F80A12
MLPTRLPYVKGPLTSSFENHEPTDLHLGLTPQRTLCQLPIRGATGDHLDVDTDSADTHHGLCRHCTDALARYRRATTGTQKSTITWNSTLVPEGRATAQLVQSALQAREHLALVKDRMYPVPEDQRADALLALLADVSTVQKNLDALADELVLALRDASRPAPSWERIGQRLEVKATAVRNRYARGATEHPDRLTLCGIGGTGCGELRPASLPGGFDPWKNHDLDHEADPNLPQDEDDY